MLLSLLLALTFLFAQQSSSSLLQNTLEYLVSENFGHGGGIARIGKGRNQVLWESAVGQSKRGGDPLQVQANFEIASTSKTFTAAAVLLMVEDGLLDLDAPIRQYLPLSKLHGLLVIQGHDYGPNLTLRQLLQHTSGLPDYWQDPPFVISNYNAFIVDYMAHPQRLWQPQEMLSYVPNLDPIFIPNQGWHYGDSGFVLAGLIMERVDGKPLQDILRDRIFRPLGMQHTWLHWRDPTPSGLQQSHRYEALYDMTTKRQNSADWAGGGLVSTVEDLQIFIHALCTKRLFRYPQTLDVMTQWVSTDVNGVDYGLGLFRVNLGFGMGEIWGHDGYGNSWMYYWPRYDISFTGTLNQTENDWWPLVVAAAWLIDRT